MNSKLAVQNVAKIAREPLETLKDQLTPIGEEARRELLGSVPEKTLGKKQQELATGELKRAREEQRIEVMKQEAQVQSDEEANRLASALQAIKQEYNNHAAKSQGQEQQDLKAEIAALQAEIAQLSKIVGQKTTVHLESTPKKVGAIDVNRLTAIVKTWRLKAKESKNAKDLVAQRQNSKPATGMLAWVSGKQMKIHEQ